MPFKAVEQVMDSVKEAAYIENELLHVFSQVHEEIIPGTDLRDIAPQIVNSEGADMDAVARDNAKAYGKPQWVGKVDNKRAKVAETRTRKIKAIHELVMSAEFTRKELKQAAKLGRPLESRRLKNGRDALNIDVRNAIYDGVPELGIDGFFSDIDNLVHEQASAATEDIADKALEKLFLGFVKEFLEEIGSDYQISHILLAPSWNARISQTYGNEGSQTMKQVLSNVLNVPVANFHVDSRLSAKSVGTYTDKDMVLLLPSHPRIFEILNPVRLRQEEPYMDGSTLVIDQTVQYGGIDFHEKVGLLAAN